MKMKKPFLLFSIKLLLLVSIIGSVFSFTSNDEVVVKYSTVIHTIVLTTDMGVNDIKSQILQKSQNGYVVKSVSGAGEYGHTWLAVMEKKIKLKIKN